MTVSTIKASNASGTELEQYFLKIMQGFISSSQVQRPPTILHFQDSVGNRLRKTMNGVAKVCLECAGESFLLRAHFSFYCSWQSVSKKQILHGVYPEQRRRAQDDREWAGMALRAVRERFQKRLNRPAFVTACLRRRATQAGFTAPSPLTANKNKSSKNQNSLCGGMDRSGR